MKKKNKRKPEGDKLNAEVTTNNKIKWYRNILYFLNPLMFSGFILILLAVIIDLKCLDNFAADVIKSVLSTIGVALFVGAIFDLSINSRRFTNYVAELLKDIIISKRFLNDLTDNNKKQALEMILRPSGDQLDQYRNIEAYFKKKIVKSMDMFHTNFKTNLVVVAKAKKENGMVKTYVNVTYRIYKIENEYYPIVTTFDRNNCNVTNTRILYPGGELNVEEECQPLKETDVSPVNTQRFEFKIPKELYEYEYLTLVKDAVECGYDHWTNFHWNTLTPAEGINFKLSCDDNLFIKEYFVFDDIDLYNINEDKDKKNIDIISTGWVDEHTGFIFTISDTKGDIKSDTTTV